jgi:Cu/Ag efflux pump CusA
MRHAARAADHPQRAVEASIQFPPGTYVVWSGQYEYLERAKAWLQIVVPATLLIILLLLYLNCRSITETMIVMLSLPFALVGGLSATISRWPLRSASSPSPVSLPRPASSC